jgi:hypothetical protein
MIITRVSCCAALLLALGSVTPAVEPVVEVDLPLTIEKVWFKPVRQSGAAKMKKLTGPLMIDDSGLEVVGKQDSVHIPLDSISMISLGKFGNDVDTEWVLLQLVGGEPNRVVGIRDGRRLGYGQQTRELFHTVREVMRSLSAAQYRVEPGHRLFDQISFQMTFAVPEDWSHFIHSAVTIGERVAQGTILFSAEPIDRMIEHDEALDGVLTGETAGFYLDRVDPGKGRNCDGLTPKQNDLLLERVAGELGIGGFEIVDHPSATDFTIAGCRGVRVEGRGRHADGREKLADLRVVSNGETMFLFGMYSTADGDTAHRDSFERVVGSVKISVSP